MARELPKPFSVRKAGHWLRSDVHDVGHYHAPEGDWLRLKPGMVLTITPGLYVGKEDLRVAPR
ncbi:M24 family metallopeptidase [Ferrimonas sediminicola]|uniref:M24 family metallopeptidase n=1 Tax=Ferrimonas sediminicola TaxID=2569538 RepID=A0A4U1BDY2_9GAMM|nr:M24 family metallopeptidase [Ferrimonas sediminicola]